MNPRTLNDRDSAGLDRAKAKGFVVLDNVVRASRQNHHHHLDRQRYFYSRLPLAVAHRNYCRTIRKPQIVLAKASRRAGGDAQNTMILDELVIDLSTMMNKNSNNNNNCLWQKEIYKIAKEYEMIKPSPTLVEQPSDNKDDDYDGGDDDDDTEEWMNPSEPSSSSAFPSVLERQEEAASSLVLVFRGERANAKAMAAALSDLWEIRDFYYNDESPLRYHNQQRRRSNNNKQRASSNSSLSSSSRLMSSSVFSSSFGGGGGGRKQQRGGGHRQAYRNW
jgi:hypothetical protein